MEEGGIFLVDKPVGPTSFDIVRRVKHIFPGYKVGHAGTLDPFASGLLLILVGKATRWSDLLMASKKTYQATLSLGKTTDTLDHTGNITTTAPIPFLTQSQIEGVFQSFLGEWLQEPPMFSAKKKGGVPLYRLARKNIIVERVKSPVHIYELKLIDFKEENVVFEVVCSKGTYVRSLGKEIAEKLGTVGHLTQLRRVQSGPFRVAEGGGWEDIQKLAEKEWLKAKQRFQEIIEKA